MSARLPLSYPQRIIWTTEERHPGTAISTLVGVVNLPPLNAALLERGACTFARRTPWLGMRIHLDAEGNPVQSQVVEAGPLVEVRSVATSDDAQAQIRQLARERLEMYDSRLFRLLMLNYPGGSSFVVCGHHILFDGTTLVTVANEVLAEYESLRTGEPRMSEATPDYAAYLEEEATYLKSPRFQRDEQYWDEAFATVPEAVNLHQNISGVGETRRLILELPDELEATLAASQQTIGQSGLTIVLGLFAAYLAELAGAEDMALATSVLGRSRRYASAIGMFANVVPVRLRVDRNVSVATHLDSVRNALFGVLRHARYPQEFIIERYRARTGSTDSLFDVNVTYQDATLIVDESEFSHQWLPYAARSSSLEINLTRRLVEEPLRLVVDYRLDTFDEPAVTTLMQRFVAYLEQALADLDRPLRKLPLGTAEELEAVHRWTQGPTLPLNHDNVVSAFREAVCRSPEALAISDDRRSLTYREADERSDAIAQLLRSHGVGADVVVPILARRSAELLVWILGIVKAGGAYLPLDVEAPADRINYVLHDCGAIVICRDPDVNVDYPTVLDISPDTYAGFEATPIDEVPRSDQLAYVIYTSGSTGHPKGAMNRPRFSAASMRVPAPGGLAFRGQRSTRPRTRRAGCRRGWSAVVGSCTSRPIRR